MNQPKTKAFLCCSEERCRATYEITSIIYACSSCGGLLDVDYDFAFPGSVDETKTLFLNRRTASGDLDRSGVWRFRELLPFVEDGSRIVTLAEGNTPLYQAPQSAHYAGLSSLTF